MGQQFGRSPHYKTPGGGISTAARLTGAGMGCRLAGLARSPEHKVRRRDGGMQKKAELEAAYPPADRRGCGGGVARGRVGGMCDFGIDELRPLDINRALSPPAVTDADFQPEREGR